jgi:phage-related protein
LRRLQFAGSSRQALKSFPADARQDAGRQLQRVQSGTEPADWKPMKSIGPGVNEIRIRDKQGAYRVIYLAKFAEAVYVLHCFEKKSQKTSRLDLEVATTRYRALVRGRAAGN